MRRFEASFKEHVYMISGKRSFLSSNKREKTAFVSFRGSEKSESKFMFLRCNTYASS